LLLGELPVLPAPELVPELLPMLPEELDDPMPLEEPIPLLDPPTVMWLVTLRLLEYDLAMLSAVFFSLLVATVPLSSIPVAVTFTLMLSLLRVGSFFNAV
jgi:hypothetical protein